MSVENQPEERFALPQEQLPVHFVSMRELREAPHRFIIVPEFQRQEVWCRSERQALIDTILLGESVPQLEGYQSFNEEGESFWHLIDGQQRMKTVIRFMSDEFKTWTHAQKEQVEPNSDLPVEGGKYFEELSIIARNYFLNYRFMIVQVRNQSLQALATRFRRIQNHEPLTAAERYHSHISAATSAAKEVAAHVFWEDFYDGQRRREQVFQSSLHLVGLEAALPVIYVELLGSKYLHALAYGRHDERITPALITRISHKLGLICTLYHGAHFTQRSAIVPMYQSIGYLDRLGYTIGERDKGKLCIWLMTLIEESKGTKPNYASRIQQLLRASFQEEFWRQCLPQVTALFGLLPDRTLITRAKENQTMHHLPGTGILRNITLERLSGSSVEPSQ
jgi:hypothetical protein